MKKTLVEFDSIVEDARNIFKKKLNEYGCSWRIFRMGSLTDQIFIKIIRVRNIQEKKNQKIKDETILESFMAILNYAIIGLIQLKKGSSSYVDIKEDQAINYYNIEVEKTKKLMQDKNYDYNEAWRLMSEGSLTDMVFQKLIRVKHIEENEKDPFILNKKIEEQYIDIINYAIFFLIKAKEKLN